MNATSLLKNLCLSAAVVSLSACGQSANSPNSIENTPGAQTVAIEQADWKGLTADAEAAMKKGDTVEAEKKYKEAMIVAAQLGESDPAQAEAVANMASFYYVQGEAQQANQLYKQSLALHEKALGMEHVDLIKDLVGLAKVSASEKNFTDSAAYYERAIAIYSKAGQPVPAELEKSYADVKKSIAAK